MALPDREVWALPNHTPPILHLLIVRGKFQLAKQIPQHNKRVVIQFLSMSPSFNCDGKLPPGIHDCTWGEFVARFGTTEHWLNLIVGLKLVMGQLREAGCPTVYIDGSFVTNKLIPGDFDACWDANGVDLNKLISICTSIVKV